MHAATALWLPACAVVLSAPSQQLDDAAYDRHTCQQAQAEVHTKIKANADEMSAAWLGHVHIAWYHDISANLDAEPDCLEQLT